MLVQDSSVKSDQAPWKRLLFALTDAELRAGFALG